MMLEDISIISPQKNSSFVCNMKWFLLCLLIFVGNNVFGQTFSIVSLESLPTDLTAATQSKLDLNGKKCGLVKVQCVMDGINFSGNVIGDVAHKDGEYWVYLTTGSKQLCVTHPNLLPLDVNFSNIAQSGISSGKTYRLILSIPEALYSSILSNAPHSDSHANSNQFNANQTNPIISDNTVMSGVVTDESDGETLIGCAVLYGSGGVATDIDGEYTLKNLKPGATIRFQYVGYKTREIKFTGKIPPKFDISMKLGKGTIKEEYFYDPNDKAEYFDLKGNKLPKRPSKKGTYLRVENGKVEKFTIN